LDLNNSSENAVVQNNNENYAECEEHVHTVSVTQLPHPFQTMSI